MSDGDVADTAWQLSPSEQDAPLLERWRRLPTPAITGLHSPADYQPTQSTVDAVNVALALGQPLLVTGEPGCGKTALASWVAYRLGFDRLLRFQTRSTAVARDLFYRFDAVGRFRATDQDDPRRFVSYTALGEAILRASGRANIVPYVAADQLGNYPEEPTPRPRHSPGTSNNPGGSGSTATPASDSTAPPPCPANAKKGATTMTGKDGKQVPCTPAGKESSSKKKTGIKKIIPWGGSGN